MANLREHVITKLKTLETYVYTNSYNDDFDNICMITFYESGKYPDVAFGKTTIARYPNFQIRLRDTNFVNGESRIEAIRSMFEAYSYQVITIIPKSDIMTMGNDNKNRAEFALNFECKLVGGNTVT